MAGTKPKREFVLGALGAGAVCVVVWGGVPIVTRVGTAEFDPQLFGVLRSVLALPIVGAMLLIMRPRLPLDPKSWALLLISGVGGFVAFPILFSIGQAMTSAAHGALVIAVIPVFTGVFVAIADRRRPGRAWVVGAALACAGEYWLIGGRANSGGSGASFVGDLLVLAGVAVAALGHVTGAKLARSIGAAAVTYWSLALAGVLMLPVALYAAVTGVLAGQSLAAWGCALYMSWLASIFCYVLWYQALDRGGIDRIAAVQFAQPLITLGLAALLLDEALSIEVLGAAALILAGVFLCQRRR